MRPTFHGSLLVVILLLLAMISVGPARQLYLEQKTISNDQRQLNDGNAESARLAARLQALRDPAFIEQLARQDLGFIRPGETAYLIVRPSPTPAPSPTAGGPSQGQRKQQ